MIGLRNPGKGTPRSMLSVIEADERISGQATALSVPGARDPGFSSGFRRQVDGHYRPKMKWFDINLLELAGYSTAQRNLSLGGRELGFDADLADRTDERPRNFGISLLSARPTNCSTQDSDSPRDRGGASLSPIAAWLHRKRQAREFRTLGI